MGHFGVILGHLGVILGHLLFVQKRPISDPPPSHARAQTGNPPNLSNTYQACQRNLVVASKCGGFWQGVACRLRSLSSPCPILSCECVLLRLQQSVRGQTGKRNTLRNGQVERREMPWSSTHEVLGVPPGRPTDVVNLAWATCARVPLFADVSQSACRHPWSQQVRSMVSASLLYSFEADRVLVGQEHLYLLGFKQPVRTATLSQAQLRHLAGEAMGIPCVTLVVLAVVSSLPHLWQQP